jgi:hypothetical protein
LLRGAKTGETRMTDTRSAATGNRRLNSPDEGLV